MYPGDFGGVIWSDHRADGGGLAFDGVGERSSQELPQEAWERVTYWLAMGFMSKKTLLVCRSRVCVREGH